MLIFITDWEDCECETGFICWSCELKHDINHEIKQLGSAVNSGDAGQVGLPATPPNCPVCKDEGEKEKQLEKYSKIWRPAKPSKNREE